MKAVLKKILFLCSLVVVSPLLLLYFLLFSIRPIQAPVFEMFSQLLSLIPGIPGNYLRAAFYSFTLQECARDAVISFNTLISQQRVVIQPGVYIGPQGNIGSCIIERDTLLGSCVQIMSGKNQHFCDNLDIPIKDQGGELTQIKIGEDCWIGNGALIMANVGSKSIIGAGSVVVDDIPPYSIAVGNPAKVVKSRI